MPALRVGQGIDVHPFSDDLTRPLVLGGVAIAGEGVRGLAGHSDADVVAPRGGRCGARRRPGSAISGTAPDTDHAGPAPTDRPARPRGGLAAAAAGSGQRRLHGGGRAAATLAPQSPPWPPASGPRWGAGQRRRRQGRRGWARWAGPRGWPARPWSCWPPPRGRTGRRSRSRRGARRSSRGAERRRAGGPRHPGQEGRRPGRVPGHRGGGQGRMEQAKDASAGRGARGGSSTGRPWPGPDRPGPGGAGEAGRASRPALDRAGGDQVEGRQAVRELCGPAATGPTLLMAEGRSGEILATSRPWPPGRRVTVRRVAPPDRTGGPDRRVPGGGGPARPMADATRGPLPARPRGAGCRSCSCSTASPTRTTSAPCCAGRVRRGDRASSPVTGRPTCRPRWPRWRPAPSSTSRWRWWPGIPTALPALAALGVVTVGLVGEAPTSLYDLPLGDRPVALVARIGGHGPGGP